MNRRITIIEDNKKIRESITAFLEEVERYEVVGQYSNCEDAICNLFDDLPDLILMDIGLPGANGIEGTAKIKKRFPSCIILIITIMEDSEKVFQSLCAGAGGYIVKNSGIEGIIRGIDEALAGGAPMSLHIARMVVRSFNRSNDSPLSVRETEVLQGIAQGKSYTKIAADLFVSKDTIRSHIKNIYQKLTVNSKSEALKIAGNKNWINKKW